MVARNSSSTLCGKRDVISRLRLNFANWNYIKFLMFDPAAMPVVTVLILIAETVLNLFIIRRVPYTEIDWIAYMQECEGFINGTTNYALLKGDTGPLVYPAAFVYIYSTLYYITSKGTNILLGQYIFGGIYLMQMWLVLRLYSKSRKLPPYVLVLSAFTSYRMHSIYVLRLFNDPIAVLLFYASLNFFLEERWRWGSIFFSLGVGVKMNILLFAPALLLFYLVNLGYLRTCVQLVVCGFVQILLGLPFLLTYPVQYLKGSFDLGRVFEHKWTVNYRFLPKDLFENRIFHLGLLIGHTCLLVIFARPTFIYLKNYTRLRELQHQLQPQIDQKNQEIPRNYEKKSAKASVPKSKASKNEKLTSEQEAFLKSFEKSLQNCSGKNESPVKPNEMQPTKLSNSKEKVSIHFDQCTQLALLPFFFCNFIGIVCARSLHYQFYVWYFHSLPYLAWCTDYSLGMRFLILGLIEFCWNTYPSTTLSSCLLHICHFVLIIGVGRKMYKTTTQCEAISTPTHVKEETKNLQKRLVANSKNIKISKKL